MKKSTRKVLNYLKQYIGNEVIRTKPPFREKGASDWSYTDEPIIILGFTTNGCIKCRHEGELKYIFGDKEVILPFSFTDRNWITYKKAKKAKNNKLNRWRGKKIKRISSTASERCDYMCKYSLSEAPTLVSASKHHMVIIETYPEDGIEIKRILYSEFTQPGDWVLA